MWFLLTFVFARSLFYLYGIFNCLYLLVWVSVTDKTAVLSCIKLPFLNCFCTTLHLGHQKYTLATNTLAWWLLGPELKDISVYPCLVFIFMTYFVSTQLGQCIHFILYTFYAFFNVIHLLFKVVCNDGLRLVTAQHSCYLSLLVVFKYYCQFL